MPVNPPPGEAAPSSVQSFMDHAGEAARDVVQGIIARYPDFGSFIEATARRRRLLRALASVRVGRMSQRDLALRMSSHQPTIVNLERGDADPRLSTLERYAASLGLVFFWQLLTSSGEPASDAFTWDGDGEARRADLLQPDRAAALLNRPHVAETTSDGAPWQWPNELGRWWGPLREEVPERVPELAL
jgi:transcriptional regulator with XRE-family HTH domain